MSKATKGVGDTTKGIGGPDELRAEAIEIRDAYSGSYMLDLADRLDAHADAWEVDLVMLETERLVSNERGRIAIERGQRLEALEKESDEYARLWHRDAAHVKALEQRLERAVALGKDRCHKHGTGDDACMCERWDALREADDE